MIRYRKLKVNAFNIATIFSDLVWIEFNVFNKHPQELLLFTVRHIIVQLSKKKTPEIERLVNDIINALLYSHSLLELLTRLHNSLWNLFRKPDKLYIVFESGETGRKFRSANLEKQYGSQFQTVFGDGFILDRTHMRILFATPEELRRGYFRKFDEASDDFEKDPRYNGIPAWTPPKEKTISINKEFSYR